MNTFIVYISKLETINTDSDIVCFTNIFKINQSNKQQAKGCTAYKPYVIRYEDKNVPEKVGV